MSATKLFGTDGVRGIAGQWPLTDELVTRLGYFAGLALARHHAKKTILVVRDTRGSGPGLQSALSRGLSAAGCRVMDGGVLPTPAVAALVPRKKMGAGAVVSASHNPSEFNGIKFFNAVGTKLAEALEREIETQVLSSTPVPFNGRHAAVAAAVKDDYVRFLKCAWPRAISLKGFTVALDCANGAAYHIAAPLLRSLGAKVFVTADKPDGNNINKECGALHPGKALAALVKKEGCDLGVAFDGDSDRAVFVDEAGVVKDGDFVLMACARQMKKEGRLKHNTVVATVMANLGFYRAMDALDIKAVETPVGDKYVWEAMQKTGAVLGGEQSGHIIFREHLATGDGLLTALEVLALLAKTGQPFSALTALVVKYPQVLVNVPVTEKKPLESFADLNRQADEIRSALGKNGRVFIRYSGTEPLLRIMIEGPEAFQINGYAQALADAARKGA